MNENPCIVSLKTQANQIDSRIKLGCEGGDSTAVNSTNLYDSENLKNSSNEQNKNNDEYVNNIPIMDSQQKTSALESSPHNGCTFLQNCNNLVPNDVNDCKNITPNCLLKERKDLVNSIENESRNSQIKQNSECNTTASSPLESLQTDSLIESSSGPSACNITYVAYESERQMGDIMRLIQKDLSEPYSIYTYRYFIHNWPNLCFLALDGTLCVGAIVCKLDLHKKHNKRGYIAMLAVDQNYRKKKIGSSLVKKAIQAMMEDDADEVVLETEITNKPALKLYENLGFVRDKRLFRYYLNGVDALRLKLWFR